MISHKHKCIFVHIPKTAGTSIETAFLEDLGLDMENRHALLLGENTNKNVGPRRISHLTASQYVDLNFVSQTIFDDYFKFAVVRNPIDRLYSTYKFKRYIDYLSFDNYIKLKLEGFIHSKVEGYFYKSQYDYLYKDNKLIVDFFGKFEELDKTFDFVQMKLETNLKLRHYNKTKETEGLSKIIRPYVKLLKDPQVWGKNNLKETGKNLSEEAIAIIEKHYRIDFEAFGYEFQL